MSDLSIGEMLEMQKNCRRNIKPDGAGRDRTPVQLFGGDAGDLFEYIFAFHGVPFCTYALYGVAPTVPAVLRRTGQFFV